jgi:hypothetical protein
MAEEREENKHLQKGSEYGGWHKAVKVDSPAITLVLKNLGVLYRHQGKLIAAETIEDFVLRSQRKVVKSPFTL